MLCPQREKLILAENANLETLMAKCIRCQHIFRFESLIPYPPKPAEPVIAKPKQYDLEENDREKFITITYRSVYVLFPIAFANLFLLFAIIGFVKAAIALDSNEVLISLTWSSFFTVASAALFYLSLFSVLNTTYIGVNESTLFAVHRPLPWFGIRVPRDSFSEIYIEKCWSSETSEQGPQHYNIYVMNHVGLKTKLGFSCELPQARFVVYWLNRWLNLSPSRLGVQIFEPPAANQTKSLS